MQRAILTACIALGLVASRLLFVGTRPVTLLFPKSW